MAHCVALVRPNSSPLENFPTLLREGKFSGGLGTSFIRGVKQNFFAIEKALFFKIKKERKALRAFFLPSNAKKLCAIACHVALSLRSGRLTRINRFASCSRSPKFLAPLFASLTRLGTSVNAFVIFN